MPYDEPRTVEVNGTQVPVPADCVVVKLPPQVTPHHVLAKASMRDLITTLSSRHHRICEFAVKLIEQIRQPGVVISCNCGKKCELTCPHALVSEYASALEKAIGN